MHVHGNNFCSREPTTQTHTGNVLILPDGRLGPPPPALFLLDGEGEDGDGNDGSRARRYIHYSARWHSLMVSPWGDVIAACDEGHAVVVAALDMNLVRETRKAIRRGGPICID